MLAIPEIYNNLPPDWVVNSSPNEFRAIKGKKSLVIRNCGCHCDFDFEINHIGRGVYELVLRITDETLNLAFGIIEKWIKYEHEHST
jgi:hypothetical protein